MPSDINHLHRLQRRKLVYLITGGQTTLKTAPATEDFARLLTLAKAAVEAKIDLFQIREKNLSAGVLYALTASIVELTRHSETKLLVNDRADIAAAAGADGVHLTTESLPASVIRRAFGDEFLIGVSTHSLTECRAAREEGANFVVYGPVFETPEKAKNGEPQGLKKLEAVASALEGFPLLALGGIGVDNVADCIRAGAQGVAAIRMLSDPLHLGRTVAQIRRSISNSVKMSQTGK